jgi:transposase
MTARQSREVTLAVSHFQRTGCTPAAAAKRYGVAVSSVRRALVRIGVAPQPVGRPVKSPPSL